MDATVYYSHIRKKNIIHVRDDVQALECCADFVDNIADSIESPIISQLSPMGMMEDVCKHYREESGLAVTGKTTSHTADYEMIVGWIAEKAKIGVAGAGVKDPTSREFIVSRVTEPLTFVDLCEAAALEGVAREKKIETLESALGEE